MLSKASNLVKEVFKISLSFFVLLTQGEKLGATTIY